MSRFSSLTNTLLSLSVLAFCYSSPAAMLNKLNVGIGRDIGIIDASQNFHTAAIPDIGTGTIFNATVFNSKIKSAYSGNATVGFFVRDNFLTELEFEYRKINKKDDYSSKNFINSSIVSGLINATYFIDIQSKIYPYAKFGIGAAKVKVNGEIYDNIGEKLKFDHLKTNTLTYQIGGGISTFVKNTIIGAGYKFAGFSNFSNSTKNRELQASVDGVNTSQYFNYSASNNNIHTLEVFAKIAIK